MEMASYADRTCTSAMLNIYQPKEGLKAPEDCLDFWDDTMTDLA